MIERVSITPTIEDFGNKLNYLREECPEIRGFSVSKVFAKIFNEYYMNKLKNTEKIENRIKKELLETEVFKKRKVQPKINENGGVTQPGNNSIVYDTPFGPIEVFKKNSRRIKCKE